MQSIAHESTHDGYFWNDRNDYGPMTAANNARATPHAHDVWFNADAMTYMLGFSTAAGDNNKK